MVGSFILCLAGSGLSQAADEDTFIGEFHPPSEKSLGQGQSALWTLSDVATQYRPLNPTAAMKEALQAQQEGRFLDALIHLDDASKGEQTGADTQVEITLLRASFLLQGNQSAQAFALLTPLRSDSQHGADAYALMVMAQLQLGQKLTLETAINAQDFKGGLLPHLAQSYALQSLGHLTEASDVMHAFNTNTPQSAIALAREAEFALTLDRIASARSLLGQAQAVDATQPYVIAVSGLAYLIDGKPQQAKAAFEIALKRDAKDAKALLGLGLAEIKMGNFKAGQKMLQAANEAEPNNALILTYLGRSQLQSGQTGAARLSWLSAQQADPKDPTPWLYQAQAELQANHLVQARDSLRQAQVRMGYRSVYRGDLLLKDDEQLLQANLAEIQRQSGLESIAFQTLSDSVGEKNSSNLRNQAEVLQGQRFGESARRSLLLQSLFNEKPGSLPTTLDSYGDGAGQTGATTPQHGAVSSLNAQQASYNNYDELFNRRTTLQVDATTGSKNSNGEQIRLGAGNEKLWLSLAGLQFKIDGFSPFENLDNRVWQATAQWRPYQSTQMFVSHQTVSSRHGEIFYPALLWGYNTAVEDNSYVTRIGLRQDLTNHSELRGLWSFQKTDQVRNNNDFADPPTIWSVWSNFGTSNAHSAELQYRSSGADYTTQWGVQQNRAHLIYKDAAGFIQSDEIKIGQQVYAAWQQALNRHWQFDAGLGWGKVENVDNILLINYTNLARWLPQLGAVYASDSGTHVRFAAWQNMGAFAVDDATLAPSTLAGVLLTHPDEDNKLVKAVSIGAEKQMNPAWLLTAETQQRKTDLPVIDTAIGQQFLVRMQLDESRFALHWQPQEKLWGVSLSFDDERIQNDTQSFAKDGVSEQHLRSQQLLLRWFASRQCTANFALSHSQIAGMEQYDIDGVTNIPISRAYQDGFNQLDADLSWKFNKSGSVTVGVRNASDTHFKYKEISKLNPRFSSGRLVYAKFKLFW